MVVLDQQESKDMNREQRENRMILHKCLIPWHKLLFSYPNSWKSKYIPFQPKTKVEEKEMLELRASLDKMMIPTLRLLVRGK